jgi:membrane-associated phospholipid phosphatase
MTVAYVLFAAGIAVVALAGLTVWRVAPMQRPSAQRGLTRLAHVRNTCREELGDHLAALVILLSLGAASLAIAWPIGRFARRFRPQIDDPFLRWTQAHTSAHGTWHHINNGLTLMGDRTEIKIICIVVAVIFAVLWRHRGWWIPVLIMTAAFAMEKGGQMLLKAVVDRSLPNLPGFGNFPSGGCARLVAVYGAVFYLVLLTWPQISRGWRVTGWTVVAALAFTEAYTRIYLIKHFGMDVVGGLVFGTVLLLALIAAMSCFSRREPSQADEPRHATVEAPSPVGVG